MYRTLFTHILHRSFNFGLVFILELVLVAHHQVGVWHAQLDNAGWKARRTAIKNRNNKEKNDQINKSNDVVLLQPLCACLSLKVPAELE